MSMMRRGPLDRYLPPWVLRQAAAQHFDGSITFHSDRPTTFFLDHGDLYAATVGTHPYPDGTEPTDPADEAEALAETVRLLVEAQCGIGGWYVLDGYGIHPDRGWWRWEVDALLLQSRARSPEVTAAAIYGSQRLGLHPDLDEATTLDPDAWAVVAAMAASATTEEIRARLGWQPTQLLTALTKLNRAGLLDAAAEPEPEIPEETEPAMGAASEVPDPGDDHPTPPPASGHEVADDAPVSGNPIAEASTRAAEAAADHRKEDLGVGDNAPSNLALRAWQEHQIPEVITGPLPVADEWVPKPEEPEVGRLRKLRRTLGSPRRAENEADAGAGAGAGGMVQT